MQLRKVAEAAYLTADNHSRYRMILRYFFIQHERMRDFIFPEEVYQYIKEKEGFETYEEDSLHQDLNQLVTWGNLFPRQEMSSAKTIEEYKKKRFRYQPTPYTIEFERMLTVMENKEEAFSGALERTQFDRLYRLLQELEEVVHRQNTIKNEEANQLWEDLQTYFRQIVQNTSDYIAYINSEEVEERMQTEAFLMYKDQFTKYLREFIRAMQSTSEQIKSVLKELPVEKLYVFFDQVWKHKAQSRLEEVEVTEETKPFEDYTGKWEAIQSWFRGTSGYGKSESEMLLERTSEAIRKITQVVQRMGERHQNFRSRREEYLYLGKWFSELEEIDEAHKLFATAFGVSHTRHYLIDQNPTDDIYTSIWDFEPMIHVTKPMIRQYSEKTKAQAVINRTEKRREARAEFLEQKRLEEKWLEKYMNNQLIELDQIEQVEPKVRQIFLSWMGKASGQNDSIIQSDFGARVKVNWKNDRIILHAEDGDLEMPNVSFELLEERGEDYA